MSDEDVLAARDRFRRSSARLAASLDLFDATGGEILVDGRLNGLLAEVHAALTTMLNLAIEYDFAPDGALRILPPEGA